MSVRTWRCSSDRETPRPRSRREVTLLPGGQGRKERDTERVSSLLVGTHQAARRASRSTRLMYRREKS